MKSLFISFITGIILGCSVSINEESISNNHSIVENLDTSSDTGEESIIPKIGIWSISDIESISDNCNIEEYQEVNSMVPSEFTIVDSNAHTFQTDSTQCNMNNLGNFICNATSIEEKALGGTATLNIETIMKGSLLSQSLMNLEFDVNINSCTGAGCFMIEMALEFPCEVTLNANSRI